MRITAGTTPNVDLADKLGRILGVTRDYADRALLNGESFSGSIPLGAVAANFARTQLYNPAASGKILIVYWLEVQSTVADFIGIKDNIGQIAGGSVGRTNQFGGGAVAVGTLTGDNVAGAPTTPYLRQFNVPANTPAVVPAAPSGLYVLLPNSRVTVLSGTVNTAQFLNAWWVEVDQVTFL